jgi:hypothetical protein
LIGWVKDDAEFIAERIAEFETSKAAPPEGTPGAAGSAQAGSTERS